MNEAPKRQVSVAVAMLTYFGMLFGSALLIMGLKGIADPNAWVLFFCSFFLFPFGLGFLHKPVPGPVGFVLIVISYISFILFFALFARVRTWGRYGLLCFGFAILLLANVAGCREGIKSFGQAVTMTSAPAFGANDTSQIQSPPGEQKMNNNASRQRETAGGPLDDHRTSVTFEKKRRFSVTVFLFVSAGQIGPKLLVQA